MTTPDVSHIDEIVDQAAATAAGVPGVVAIWGAGSGLVVDPILTAQQSATTYVRAGLPSVVKEGTHVSELPNSAEIRYRSATVAELTWEIPMRLYLSRADEITARRQASKFYAGYVTAFAANTMLGASVNSALITRIEFFQDAGWDKQGVTWWGLDFTLTAIERLDLELQAGAGTWPP